MHRTSTGIRNLVGSERRLAMYAIRTLAESIFYVDNFVTGVNLFDSLVDGQRVGALAIALSALVDFEPLNPSAYTDAAIAAAFACLADDMQFSVENEDFCVTELIYEAVVETQIDIPHGSSTVSAYNFPVWKTNIATLRDRLIAGRDYEDAIDTLTLDTEAQEARLKSMGIDATYYSTGLPGVSRQQFIELVEHIRRVTNCVDNCVLAVPTAAAAAADGVYAGA